MPYRHYADLTFIQKSGESVRITVPRNEMPSLAVLMRKKEVLDIGGTKIDLGLTSTVRLHYFRELAV